MSYCSKKKILYEIFSIYSIYIVHISDIPQYSLSDILISIAYEMDLFLCDIVRKNILRNIL